MQLEHSCLVMVFKNYNVFVSMTHMNTCITTTANMSVRRNIPKARNTTYATIRKGLCFLGLVDEDLEVAAGALGGTFISMLFS